MFRQLGYMAWCVLHVERCLLCGRNARSQVFRQLHHVKNLKPRDRGGGPNSGERGAGAGRGAATRPLTLPGPLGRLIAPFLSGLLGRLTYGAFTYRLPRSGPLFAFVGVTALGQDSEDEPGAPPRRWKGLLSRRDELEAVCASIREAIRQRQCRGAAFGDDASEDSDVTGAADDVTVAGKRPEGHVFSLEDLSLKGVIGTGCNAVVYAGRWKTEDGSDGLESAGDAAQDGAMGGVEEAAAVEVDVTEVQVEPVTHQSVTHQSDLYGSHTSREAFTGNDVLSSAELDEDAKVDAQNSKRMSQISVSNSTCGYEGSSEAKARRGSLDLTEEPLFENVEYSGYKVDLDEISDLYKQKMKSISCLSLSNAEWNESLPDSRFRTEPRTLSKSRLPDLEDLEEISRHQSNTSTKPNAYRKVSRKAQAWDQHKKNAQNKAKSSTKHVRFASSVQTSTNTRASNAEAAADASTEEETPPAKTVFPLAVKMVFNYEAQSNAPAIISALYRELLPARSVQLDAVYDSWREEMFGEARGVGGLLRGRFGRSHTALLPPHPSLVEMPCVFVARIPLLPGAARLYPSALPPRLCSEGAGRNMSLFCVMRRYDCTLESYLRQHGTPSPGAALLLFTQLLEALEHLSRHHVAHRDIKPDNVLLTLPSDPSQAPWLVLTDFGCSLSASSAAGLTVAFLSREADPRQGNVALMAPEVRCARPGLLSSVNFSRCDAWAAASLAYPLYGRPNPFLSGLSSASYRPAQLPPLPAPPLPGRLVAALLRRRPAARPTATLAATVAQLALWAPQHWLQAKSRPPHSEVSAWLVSLTTKALCERPAGCDAEYRLVSLFLGRLTYGGVLEALAWCAAN